MQSEIRIRAEFSNIRYSQCWEDPALLEAALQIGPGDDVLSICSAGCNSLALLLQNPRSIVALDFSLVQVCLTELKMAAIKTLDYGDFVAFVGVRAGAARAALYRHVRGQLSDTARGYWDQHTDAIERGLLTIGRFENYLRVFRERMLPLIHSRRTVRRLLALESLEAQRELYHRVWNNRRWRFLFRIFFGKFLLGRLGRDPAFFRYVNIENVGEHFLGRAAHALNEMPVRGNYFLEFILTGAYANPESMHPYLLEKNFQFLRENVDRLRLVNDELEKFLQQQPEGAFSALNLSDIFEWMSPEAYEALLRAIVRRTRPGGRLAYWNLLVLREHPASMNGLVAGDRAVASKLHHQDRAFVYRNFVVERALEGASAREEVPAAVQPARDAGAVAG